MLYMSSKSHALTHSTFSLVFTPRSLESTNHLAYFHVSLFTNTRLGATIIRRHLTNVIKLAPKWRSVNLRTRGYRRQNTCATSLSTATEPTSTIRHSPQPSLTGPRHHHHETAARWIFRMDCELAVAEFPFCCSLVCGKRHGREDIEDRELTSTFLQ